MTNIPVLFVIFNRPETASRSFESIRHAQPRKLYLACDGSRADKEGEAELVEKTRRTILDAIDWECDVKTLFQDSNLGCGPGVFTAISWLFDNEERGVVIEDDCVVNDSFFRFMEEMLERYKDDQRIGMVAGSNLISAYKEKRSSYFFSRFKSCWGWGTWRRAWQNMDMEMTWRETNLEDVIQNNGYHGKDISKWRFELNCIDNGHVSAWDWQWYLSLSAQNQLCIYPAVNLVSNIGDDSTATHTSLGTITYQSHELQFPLTAPRIVAPNEAFDKAFYAEDNTLRLRIQRRIPHKVRKKLKQIVLRILNK